jgi:hypothetical protein
MASPDRAVKGHGGSMVARERLGTTLVTSLQNMAGAADA